MPELTKRQKDMLKLIADNPSITKEELAQKLSVGTTTIAKDITKLKKAKIIARDGSKQKGAWEILKNVSNL